MLNGAGLLRQESTYYPFGGEQGVLNNTIDNRYKFTGLERDGETGNDATQFRMYESNLGRWMTPDPVAGDISNPQSLNRYAYVFNNPVNFIDPLGLYKHWPPDDSNTVDTVDDWDAMTDLLNHAPVPGSSQEPGGRGGAGGGSGGGSTPPAKNVLTANEVAYLVHENNLSSFCDDLIDCIIFKESSTVGGFDANALGVPFTPKGRTQQQAKGLMQVTQDAATDVANSKDYTGFPSGSKLYDQLFDPATNIQAGSAYLDIWVNHYAHGDLKAGIAGYGTGDNYATDILNCVQKLGEGNVVGAMAAAHGH